MEHHKMEIFGFEALTESDRPNHPLPNIVLESMGQIPPPLLTPEFSDDLFLSTESNPLLQRQDCFKMPMVPPEKKPLLKKSYSGKVDYRNAAATSDKTDLWKRTTNKQALKLFREENKDEKYRKFTYSRDSLGQPPTKSFKFSKDLQLPFNGKNFTTDPSVIGYQTIPFNYFANDYKEAVDQSRIPPSFRKANYTKPDFIPPLPNYPRPSTPAVGNEVALISKQPLQNPYMLPPQELINPFPFWMNQNQPIRGQLEENPGFPGHPSTFWNFKETGLIQPPVPPHMHHIFGFGKQNLRPVEQPLQLFPQQSNMPMQYNEGMLYFQAPDRSDKPNIDKQDGQSLNAFLDAMLKDK